MEITKTNQTVNVSATTTNGEISYSFNYGTQENKLVSLTGQVNKKGIQLGSFSMNDFSGVITNTNFNFNSNATLTDKQSIIADVEMILNNVTLTLNEAV
ncbi:MAG: hypothetical protein JZU53_06915 [Paludibacter sp.]|nr:hypothetical protein [Paludibacter sp.]